MTVKYTGFFHGGWSRETVEDRGRLFKPENHFENLPNSMYSYELQPQVVDGFTCLPCGVGERCPCCGRPTYHHNEIIVAIDGACRNNGRVGGETTIGVWFGEGGGIHGGIHNVTMRTTDSTSQQAEIRAATMALEQYQEAVYQGWRTRDIRVVLKSDSAYLASGMSDFINTWKING